MTTTPTAVLGFQQGRPGSAEELAGLNQELAAALAAERPAGLLDYQVVQDAARPERFCAYWLWADWDAREALFAAPAGPPARFRAAAEPLWSEPPVVVRYTWQPEPPPVFCAAGGTVRLTPTAPVRPEPPARLLAPVQPGSPVWIWQPGGTGPPAGGTNWHPCGTTPEREGQHR